MIKHIYTLTIYFTTTRNTITNFILLNISDIEFVILGIQYGIVQDCGPPKRPKKRHLQRHSPTGYTDDDHDSTATVH